MKPLQSELDLSLEAFETLVQTSMGFLLPFLAQLPETQVFKSFEANRYTNSDFNAQKKPTASPNYEPLPTSPQALTDILTQVFQTRLHNGVEYASGANLSAFPGGGLLISAVADMITAVINRYATIWALSPGMAQIERDVIQWFIQIMGLDSSAGGLLTTGSSMATFSAFLCARKHGAMTYRTSETSLLSKATYYVSDLGHYACRKNAMMTGLPEQGIRVIPTDTHFKMDLPTLRHQIQLDQTKGHYPTLIVGNVGNTYTGTVDDLEGLAKVATDTGVWLHLDAAYGGFFKITDAAITCLKGIEQADSIALDPHKTLCLPLGSGALLVKDRQHLMRAHQAEGYRYAPTQNQGAAEIDFSECSPELSRECRGLRIWLPMKMLGLDAFKHNLEEKIQLIKQAYTQLLTIPQVQIICPPQLTVLTFRYQNDQFDEATLNRINRGLLEHINSKNQVRLMRMNIKGQETLRICALSFRTQWAHLEAAISLIKETFIDKRLIARLGETTCSPS